MLETICQIGIFVLGTISVYLMSRKNRWGVVVTLISQPFFLISTYRNNQWGMFALATIYTVCWISGLRHWFAPRPPHTRPVS
jgi:hypothetical protein